MLYVIPPVTIPGIFALTLVFPDTAVIEFNLLTSILDKLTLDKADNPMASAYTPWPSQYSWLYFSVYIPLRIVFIDLFIIKDDNNNNGPCIDSIAKLDETNASPMIALLLLSFMTLNN